mmetsp:Transcript_16895/g.27756  ORF Transcript_16895/g.27756 Transcript_16895/m.27756 type:complete len:214 (+) Transcript_16895:241-882(+)
MEGRNHSFPCKCPLGCHSFHVNGNQVTILLVSLMWSCVPILLQSLPDIQLHHRCNHHILNQPLKKDQQSIPSSDFLSTFHCVHEASAISPLSHLPNRLWHPIYLQASYFFAPNGGIKNQISHQRASLSIAMLTPTWFPKSYILPLTDDIGSRDCSRQLAFLPSSSSFPPFDPTVFYYFWEMPQSNHHPALKTTVRSRRCHSCCLHSHHVHNPS